MGSRQKQPARGSMDAKASGEVGAGNTQKSRERRTGKLVGIKSHSDFKTTGRSLAIILS